MNKTTEFGFDFGAMSVTRTCEDKKGVAIISIETQKTKFGVIATKTGKVRFFDNQGNECELVNKSYIQQLHANQIIKG